MTREKIVELDRYTLLPVDADGVPVHIGDTVESKDGRPFIVNSIEICNNTLLGMVSNDEGFSWHACELRHSDEDTWEGLFLEANEHMVGECVNCEWVLDLLGRARKLAEAGL